MAFLLYILIAGALLAFARRVIPLSLAAGLALLALPLLFTGRALVTGRVFAPVDLAYTAEPLASMARSAGVTHAANATISDVYAQFIPWNAALRWADRHHEWPLWNPFELCGSPLAAAAQSAPYHPFTLVALALPQADALTFAATLFFFVAALSLFLFARDLELHEMAALFGAAGWAFATHVMTFVHTAHGNSLAMMPFVLLAARRTARQPALLVVALTLLLLCGHPETALHVIFVGSVYALFELQRGERKRSIVNAFLAGAIALLLLAFFLLPMLDAMTQTREWLHRVATPERNMNYVKWSSVASEVFPSTMLIAAALYALVVARTRRTYFFLGVLIFGCLMGGGTPILTDVFNHLPLFSIAINTRMVTFAAFALSVLAAIGIDGYLRSEERVPIAAAWLPFREIAPLILALAIARVAPSRRIAAAGFLALLLLQRGGQMSDSMPSVERRAFFPPIAGLRSLPHDDDDPYRVVAQSTLLTPNIATQYELEDARGYQAMTLARFAAAFPLWSHPQPVWSNRVDNLTSPMLSLMNVRYALAPSRSPTPPYWLHLGTYPGFELLENERALPRAFIPRVVHSAHVNLALDAMARCSDFGGEAWIETEDASQSAGRVNAIRRHGSKLRLSVSMDGDGWVVVSEPAWRGWRVFERDRELPIAFADAAFIAFRVSKGDHDIRIFYRPRSFELGVAISLATVALLIAYAVISARRKRSPIPP